MSAPEDHLEACVICLQADCEHTAEEQDAHKAALLAGEDAPVRSHDEEQTKAIAKTAKQKEKQKDQDLKWIMSDARGRRFMWSLISRCGIYRNSYLAGRGQPEATAFHEGERNIGLETLAALLKVTPKAYATMTEENTP